MSNVELLRHAPHLCSRFDLLTMGNNMTSSYTILSQTLVTMTIKKPSTDKGKWCTVVENRAIRKTNFRPAIKPVKRCGGKWSNALIAGQIFFSGYKPLYNRLVLSEVPEFYVLNSLLCLIWHSPPLTHLIMHT